MLLTPRRAGGAVQEGFISTLLALAVLLSSPLPAHAQKKLQPLDSARLASELDGVLSTLTSVLKTPKSADPFAPLDGARKRLDAVESGLASASLQEPERKSLQTRLGTARSLLEKTFFAIGCEAGPRYAKGFSPGGGSMAKGVDCLLSDLSDLQGPLPVEVLKVLHDRLSRVRSSLLQEGLPAAESRAIEERLNLALALLNAIRRTEVKAPQQPKKGAPLADDLRKTSALPAAELGAVYDNSRGPAPGEEPLPVGPAQTAAPKDDTRPVKLQLSLHAGSVPKPERETGASLEPKPKGTLEKLEDSLFAAAGALAGLTDEGKRALFLRTRQDAQERLMTQAGRALLDLGLAPEEFPTLGAADAKLYSLQDKKAQVPSLSGYLAQRGLYQIFMQQSLDKGAIPQDLRLSPWELGLDSKGVVSVETRSVSDDGSSFRGILTRFEDETVRFEGSDGSSSLIEAELAKDGRTVRTRIDYGANGRPGKTRTTVLSTATRKKIHEELVDLAKSLTTHAFFDDLGAISRIETVNTLTGERELDDRTGKMRMRSKDGKAVVSSSDLSSVWASQEGILGEDGRFLMQRMVRRDGKTVETVSPNIVRVSDPGGANASYIMNIAELTGGLKGKARDAHAWDLAGQIVKALGLPDEGKACSRALQTWLWEVWPLADRYTDARVTFTKEDGFTLIYKMKDGRMRVERASFGSATPYAGQARGERAIVVLRPMFTDRQGNGTQDPRRWAEFLETGAYHQWHSKFGVKPAGWFRDAAMTEEVSLIRKRWSGDAETGKWVVAGSEVKEAIVNPVPGTSTAGAIWNGIWDTPVVGHVLKGGKWVGQTVVTGVGAGGTEIYYWATGNEAAGYYAAHGYANMPAMRAFMDADGYLSRLSPDQRNKVEERAYGYRTEGLRDAGYSPERTERNLYLAMYYTPFTKEELLDVLAHARDKRHIDRIIASGLKRSRAGETGGTDGGTLNFLKTASQDALDPILRAALGVAGAAQALDGRSGRPEGESIIRDIAGPAALRGAGLTQSLLGGTPYAPWVAGGSTGTGGTDGAPSAGGPSTQNGQKPSPKPESIASLGKTARESSDPAQVSEAHKQLEGLKQILLDQAREAEGLPSQSALAKGGLVDLLKKGLDRFFDGNHAPGTADPAPTDGSLARGGVVPSGRVSGERTRGTPVRKLVAVTVPLKGEKETPAGEEPARALPVSTAKVLTEAAEKTSLDPVFAGGTPTQPGGPKSEGGGGSGIPPMGPTRPQPTVLLAKADELSKVRPNPTLPKGETAPEAGRPLVLEPGRALLPEGADIRTPLVPGPAARTQPKSEAETQPGLKTPIAKTQPKSDIIDTIHGWVSDVKSRLLDAPREQAPAGDSLAKATPSVKPLVGLAPTVQPETPAQIAKPGAESTTVVDHSLTVSRGGPAPAREAEAAPSLKPQASQAYGPTTATSHSGTSTNQRIFTLPTFSAESNRANNPAPWTDISLRRSTARPNGRMIQPAGRKPVVRITRLHQPHETLILRSSAALAAAADEPSAADETGSRRAEPAKRNATTDRVRALAAAAASVQTKQPPMAPAVSTLRQSLNYGMLCGRRLARLMAGHAPSTPILLLLLVLCALAYLGPNAFAAEEDSVRFALAI
ncbi:MAG: hypothetical protein WC728_03485 [Elusimicrobiota bacterium]